LIKWPFSGTYRLPASSILVRMAQNNAYTNLNTTVTINVKKEKWGERELQLDG
jgi:hypothetical protein